MKCIQPEQIPSMEQYKEIILYGDETSPKTQEKLTEYLQKHDSLKVQLSFLTTRMTSLARTNRLSHMRNCKRRYFL